MNILCKCLGGSHLYGLNGPESDLDIRGIYSHTDLHNIIGIGKNEQQIKQSDSEDSVFVEFRHALKQLKQGNTQIIELLFNEKWESCSDFWVNVCTHRLDLIDSDRLFKCLMGYIQGEKRLAFGERTGTLGSKRKNQLDKYGFSPKNVVQLLRLAFCGNVFFEINYFPTNLVKYDIYNFLHDIKFKPETFSKDYLIKAVDQAERDLKLRYDSRVLSTTFKDDIADNLCLSLYKKYIT